MPYIKAHYREVLDEAIDSLVNDIVSYSPFQVGLVNYTIARLISRLLKQSGLSYATLNQMIGALECCKLELYRRLAASYEDRKIEQNGDVFDG